MLKKTYLIILLILSLWFLSWCKWEFKYLWDENKSWTKVESLGWDLKDKENEQEKKIETSSKGWTWDKIIIYVDKNCEDSNMQACERGSLNSMIETISDNKDDFEIKYSTKEENKKLTEIAWWMPVIVIPESKLSSLKVEKEVREQAKKVWDTYYQAVFVRAWWEENLCNDGKDNNGDWKIDAEDETCMPAVAISSKKCETQYCQEASLQNTFLWYHVKVLQYNEGEWKKMYDKLAKDWIDKLPIILIKEKNSFMKTVPAEWFKEVKWIDWYKHMILSPAFDYDPKIEACDTDCNSSEVCKKLAKCNKSKKPEVELFVMSYCPYWTQAQKWILPAVNLLKDKIDFKVRFVNYIMHQKREIDENTLQHCIQKDEPSKFIDYLTCFLWNGNTEACKSQAKINEKKMKKCISEEDKKYWIEDNWKDQSKRLGRYPRYLVDNTKNIQYWVKGSPTLVINWNQVQPKSRSPKAYLDAICESFDKKPSECDIKEISDENYDPMFWWTQQWKTAPAWVCWN